MDEQLPAFYNTFPWWREVLEWGHNKALSVASDYYVDDIKEKYGQLRVYLTWPARSVLDEDYYPRGAQLDQISQIMESKAHHVK